MSELTSHEDALRHAYIENAQFDGEKIIDGWIDYFTVESLKTTTDALNQATSEDLAEIKPKVIETIGQLAIERVDAEFIFDLLATLGTEGMAPWAKNHNIAVDVAHLNARTRQSDSDTIPVAA